MNQIVHWEDHECLIHTVRFVVYDYFVLLDEFNAIIHESVKLRGVGSYKLHLCELDLKRFFPLCSSCLFRKHTIDLFPMSSCIATRSLVHNGGYIQNPLQLLNWFEIL